MVSVPIKKKDPSPSPSPSPTPSSSPTKSSPSPSPTKPSPSPSPTKPSPSPAPHKLDLRSSFEWEELNRLKEMFTFFDTVVVPIHKKYGIDPKITAFFLSQLTENSLNIMQNKTYLEAPRGLSIESAISIIDEEMPKLLERSKNQGVSPENIVTVWDSIKKIVRAVGK